mgnify:CR=1 FL=1
MANVIWGNSNDSMASTAGAPQGITDSASAVQLSRIADALETIIDMIKKDQEDTKKRWEKENIGE